MSPPPWDEPWEERHGQEQDWSSYPNRPEPNSHSGPPKTTNLSRKWSRRHAHNIINEREQELSNARQGGETKVSQCARPVRQGRGRAQRGANPNPNPNPNALMPSCPHARPNIQRESKAVNYMDSCYSCFLNASSAMRRYAYRVFAIKIAVTTTPTRQSALLARNTRL